MNVEQQPFSSSLPEAQTKKRKRSSDVVEGMLETHNERMVDIGLRPEASQEQLTQTLRQSTALQSELESAIGKLSKKFTGVFQPLLPQLSLRFLADTSAARYCKFP